MEKLGKTVSNVFMSFRKTLSNFKECFINFSDRFTSCVEIMDAWRLDKVRQHVKRQQEGKTEKTKRRRKVDQTTDDDVDDILLSGKRYNRPEEEKPVGENVRTLLCFGHLVQCYFDCVRKGKEMQTFHNCQGMNVNTTIKPSGGASVTPSSFDQLTTVVVEVGELCAYAYYRFGF